MIQTTTTEAIASVEIDTVGKVDRSLVSGIAWTVSAKWLSQLISWASFLIVTRLLSPADFGLAGMAVLYCGLLQLVTDALGTAVTTLRELTGEQLAQLNSVALASGFVAFALSCALAIPLGHFFKSPRLPWAVVVMSVILPISGARIVPYSLLYRDMRFRLLSILDATQAICQALIMLALAWHGFGYWTLVLGNIVGAATGATLQISCRPYRFAMPRFSALRNALTFSRHIMVSNLSWYGYSNADFLVAGRVLGQTALGAYSLAWNLATLPLEKITAVVSNVCFAYFAAAQKDHALLRRHLRNLTEGLSLITFPATIGLALVAGDFIRLFLGAKWEAAIAPLEILAFYASLRCIVTLLPSILNVTGESRFVMWIMQGALVFMPVTFYIGSRWGPAGIAYAWLFAYPAVAGCLYRRAFRKIGMPVAEYLEAIRPALTGCLAMVAIVEVLKRALLAHFPLPVRLSLEVFSGGATYVVTLVLLHYDRLSLLWNFLKTLRKPGLVEPVAQPVSVT